MSAWVVVPSLLKLRDEFNLVSPKRDKGADGTIGDTSHSSSSDHTPDEDSRVLRDHDADSKNEVHALDIDSTGPWPDGKRGDIEGSWFDKKIKGIIAVEKKRWEDPNDMCRLNYIIWRGMIYDKDNDWKGKVYTATSDKHVNHAHFSARYETRAESDTRPWGVYVPPQPVKPPAEDLPVDQKSFNTLFLGALKDPAVRKEVGGAILEASGWSPGFPQRTLAQHAMDLQVHRNFEAGHPDAKGPQVDPESPLAKMAKAADIIITQHGSGTVHAS